MNTLRFLFAITTLTLASCIGDDILVDFVEPQIRLAALPTSIAAGDTYQVDATFLNNVGQPESRELGYSSSDPSVFSITDTGLLTANGRGTAQITVSTEYEGALLQEIGNITVAEETVQPPANTSRIGSIRTTSSYALTGEFEITETDGGISIAIADDYVASRALPGLYIYLTNNRNTNVGALEIGKVQVYEGAHAYDVAGVSLDEYSHILYFCKPFGVKVGDGAIEQ